VNRHYRRITSQLGMDAARFVTRNASTSAGVRTVTFTEIEKIDRIIDVTDSTAIRLVDESSTALASRRGGHCKTPTRTLSRSFSTRSQRMSGICKRTDGRRSLT
jgi:hypothetical protein